MGSTKRLECFTRTDDVTTCLVPSTVEAEYVNDPPALNKKVVQMINANTTMSGLPNVVPVSVVSTAIPTPNTSTATVKSNANAQKSLLYRTHKYWKLRHSLFSKFDEGIMLDEVSMYSVCPEVLAQHMAKRCSFETVLDPFCGAGGNAVQLAFTCHHVIAIDVDPKKIALARRNAEVYGVADRISFRVADFFLAAANIRVDAVVTSPPWGGPGYERRAKFDAGELCSRESGGMAAILRVVRAVAPIVVLHVPKNIDKVQCLQMATNEAFSHIQYESVTIDRKPNCLNLYLTRNNAHYRRAPVQTSTLVHLSTPTIFGQQRIERMRNDNMSVYASYLDRIARFLDS